MKMFNMPDNTVRETRKEKQQKEIKKKAISSQLKLSVLRDRLLDFSLVFLINSDEFFDLQAINKYKRD